MSTTISFLDRMLDPIIESFMPEMAQRVVALRTADDLQERNESLRSSANAGTLTTAEEAEYKEFVDAVDVVSLMQAKARRQIRLASRS